MSSIRSILEDVEQRGYVKGCPGDYADDGMSIDQALKDISELIDEALHSNMPSGYSTPDYRSGFNRAESNLRELLK